MSAFRPRILILTAFLLSTARCSNLGFLLTKSGLEAIKTQIINDLTTTLVNARLPDLGTAQVKSEDMQVYDVEIRSIDLKPENLKIELESDGHILVKVSGAGADFSCSYTLNSLLLVKGRTKIVAKNIAVNFKLKLGYEKGYLTTECDPKGIKITIGELDMGSEKVDDSSKDFLASIAFKFKDTVKNQATDIANKNAKSACEAQINPNLKALDLSAKVDEPMTKSKFKIAFAPAKEPTFVSGGLFYQTDLQLAFDASSQIGNSNAKVTPTKSFTNFLDIPKSPIDADMIISVRQELISDALNLLFSTKKQFKVEIVAAEDLKSQKSPKPVIYTASPTLMGTKLPIIDLTDTINKMEQIAMITSLGLPTIIVELPKAPTVSIIDKGLRVEAQVRCTIEFNHPKHSLKLKDEGFGVTVDLEVSLIKVEDAQKKPGSAPQFNAVVKPAKVSVKYAPWPAAADFKPSSSPADAIAHLINPILEHCLALIDPVVVPLPVKEELRAMGIPGNPTNLFLKFSSDKTMTVALKGEFDFKSLINTFLNPQIEQVSVLGLATEAKALKKMV